MFIKFLLSSAGRKLVIWVKTPLLVKFKYLSISKKAVKEKKLPKILSNNQNLWSKSSNKVKNIGPSFTLKSKSTHLHTRSVVKKLKTDLKNYYKYSTTHHISF